MDPQREIADKPDLRREGPGYFTVGAGTPVVMLHSSLSSKSQWTALAERLASRFRVIALDLCGYGDNAPLPAAASFTLDDEVRLVAAHVDRLVPSGTRVHLVGHSYGGLVALRFAHCRGERVASLSVYEPVIFRMLDEGDTGLTDIARRAEHIARLVAAGRRHEATQAFVDFWSGKGSYASLSLSTRAKIAHQIDKVSLDFRAAMRWPLHPTELRTIVAPTLLLAGHRSPAFMQRIINRAIGMLPDRRLSWFDTGHMGPITDASPINARIEAFLDARMDCDALAARLHALVAPSACALAAD